MPNPPKNNDPEKNSPKKFWENLYNEKNRNDERDKEKDLLKDKTSWKDHNNWFVRSSARVGYTVWIVVMAVGLLLAFGVSVFLL